jgi:membrane protease YdiL (CAAX protease family)
LPGGVAWGIVGAAIVLPISFFVAGLTTWIYDRIHFQHPQAHELLLQMNSANGWIRADLVIAATIIAPLFEELLFRGHLQTLIRRVLHPRRRHIWPTDAASPPAIMTQPVLNAAAATPAQPATPDNPPIVEYATPPMPLPGVRQTWLAILIASMLFTAVHPMWMWPPLFVLAVGLGYAYERTGNLWTCMTMHCAFNSVSTAAYLLIGK